MRFTGKIVAEDCFCTGSVSGLCIDGGTRDMRSHRITADAVVVLDVGGHVVEGVVLGRWLLVSDVTTVTENVAGFECSLDVLGVDDGATGGVDDPGTLLHPANLLGVDKALGTFVEGAVDGEDVELGKEFLEVFDADGAGLLLEGVIALVVVVGELGAVEGLQSLKDTRADTSRTEGTDNLAFEIVRLPRDLGDVPVTLKVLSVGGDKVSDENEDGHDNVLGDRGDVGAGDFVDRDVLLVGNVEIDVVRTDTCGDAALEVLGLLEDLGGQVGGVEGGSDDNLSILDVLAELGVGGVLVSGNDELVTLLLEPIGDAELVLDSAEQTGLLLAVLAGGVKDSDDLMERRRSKRASDCNSDECRVSFANMNRCAAIANAEYLP